MYIRSLEYSQWDGDPRKWQLDGCTFGNINLIVGKNASGKSKTLSVIYALGKVFEGSIKNITSANFKEVAFEDSNDKINFSLEYKNGKVVREILKINGREVLERGSGGKGRIFYEKENIDIEFQTPEIEVASFSRRDSIQHTFLNQTYNWGQSIRYYAFGRTLGQDKYAVFGSNAESNKLAAVNIKQSEEVVAIVKKAIEKFGAKFKNKVIKKMDNVGYGLEDIIVAPVPDISIIGLISSKEVVGISVKEKDLSGWTSQPEMSQGMFRALSLLSQLTYSEMSKEPICILIDDIGEGLDFERSVAIIKLLVDSVQTSGSQLIMTTNERFIMNSVPIEYWSIIQRNGNVSRVFNYRNAKKLFDDFSFTGLSNFDLFSSNYYLKELKHN